MNKYTVIWAPVISEETRADYITVESDLMSTDQLVVEAITQNIGDFEFDDNMTIESFLDAGYYLYAILRGHCEVIY